MSTIIVIRVPEPGGERPAAWPRQRADQAAHRRAPGGAGRDHRRWDRRYHPSRQPAMLSHRAGPQPADQPGPGPAPHRSARAGHDCLLPGRHPDRRESSSAPAASTDKSLGWAFDGPNTRPPPVVPRSGGHTRSRNAPRVSAAAGSAATVRLARARTARPGRKRTREAEAAARPRRRRVATAWAAALDTSPPRCRRPPRWRPRHPPRTSRYVKCRTAVGERFSKGSS